MEIQQNPTKRDILNQHGQALSELVEQKWTEKVADEEYLQAVGDLRAETTSKLEQIQEP